MNNWLWLAAVAAVGVAVGLVRVALRQPYWFWTVRMPRDERFQLALDEARGQLLDGNPRVGLLWTRRALRLNRTSIEALSLKGELLRQLGLFWKAVACFDHARREWQAQGGLPEAASELGVRAAQAWRSIHSYWTSNPGRLDVARTQFAQWLEFAWAADPERVRQLAKQGMFGELTPVATELVNHWEHIPAKPMVA